MTNQYLQPWATADEASEWLQAATGQPWPLSRMVSAGATMGIWVEPAADTLPDVMEHVFQGRTIGFMAGLEYSSDRERLAFVRDGGTLTIFSRPDGVPIRVDPPLKFPASELRFKAESLKTIAEACGRGANLGDQRRVKIRMGDVSITEDSPGLAAFIELNGGPAALEGARIELLNFVPLAALAGPQQVEAPAADVPIQTAVEPGVGTAKLWTPERLEELRRYRAEHGTNPAAKKFGISPQRVRQLLPTDTQKPKGYSAFNRPK